MKSSNREPEKFTLHLVKKKSVLFGRKCSECGGHLFAPKAGQLPDVCGPTCRQRKKRRIDREQKQTGT